MRENSKPTPYQPQSSCEAESIEKKGPLNVKVNLKKPKQTTDECEPLGPIPMEHDPDEDRSEIKPIPVAAVPYRVSKISDIIDDPENPQTSIIENGQFTFSQPCNYSSEV